MRRLCFSIGAQDSSTSLRTFFCCLVLLLPFYGVPDRDVGTANHKDSHADGMGAPPPPLLESYSRLTAFSNPERRLIGALPVKVYLGVVKRVWHVALPLLALKAVTYTDLALFQQWRLEGG